MKLWRQYLGDSTALIIACVMLGAGCGQNATNEALDSDANGFFCRDCNAKFYTDRKVFANHCPDCGKGNIEMIIGFACPLDNTVTYDVRGKGSIPCASCGKKVSSIVIPREKELVGWGAVKKTPADVGVE